MFGVSASATNSQVSFGAALATTGAIVVAAVPPSAAAYAAPTLVGAKNASVIRLDRVRADRAGRSTTSWLNAFKSIQRWKSLSYDWDGQNGEPPSECLLRRGLAYLSALYGANVPTPKLVISGDGEVDFRWKSGDGFAVLSLSGDSGLLAYVRPPKQEQVVVDYDGDQSDFTDFGQLVHYLSAFN